MTMKRIGSELFLSDLVAACGGRQSDTTWRVYRDQLAKWKLSDAEWSWALDAILRDRAEKDLPALGVIYEYLKRAQVELRGKSNGQARYVFELDGRKYATRKFDLASGARPAIPERAERVVLVVDNPDTRHEQVATREEARDAFRAGWIESGADPGKCDAVFNAIDAGRPIGSALEAARPQARWNKPIADYDDSPAALPARLRPAPAPDYEDL